MKMAESSVVDITEEEEGGGGGGEQPVSKKHGGVGAPVWKFADKIYSTHARTMQILLKETNLPN